MADPSSSGRAAVDVVAVLAALQDQIDDLTAAVEAQQCTIDELVRDRNDRRGTGGARNTTGRG